MSPLNGKSNVPSISVVIPTYNRAPLLTRALRSVHQQTLRPNEIVIVDDGSIDETESVVRSLEWEIPIEYLREDNQGPAVARNSGVTRARGEWVAFLDSDDEWCSTKIEVQLDVVCHTSPESQFIYSDVDLIDEQGVPVWQRVKEVEQEIYRIFFGNRPQPLPSTVMMRRDLFLDLQGFHPGLRYGEDFELFARVADRFPLWHVPKPLVRYRWHAGQCSRVRPLFRQYWPVVLESLEHLSRNDQAKRAVVHRSQSRYHSDEGKLAIAERRIVDARQHARKALRLVPFSGKNLRRWLRTEILFLSPWRMHRAPLDRQKTPRDSSDGTRPSRVCPACGFCSTRFLSVGQHTEESPQFRQSYTLHRCSICFTEFALPGVEAPPAWYELRHEYYGWRWEFDLFLADVEAHRAARVMDRPIKVLEVGCGEGVVMEQLQIRAEVVGVEFNRDAVQVARSKGLHIHEGDLSSFRRRYSDAAFDAIALFQVLEHVGTPWKLLADVRAQLASDGFIVCSVPHPHRYTLVFKRESWDFPPHHLTRFSVEGLRSLLRRAGFEVVRVVDRPIAPSDIKAIWRLLYEAVPLPTWIRQVLKAPLRLTLLPVARQFSRWYTGQDLYVVARPMHQPDEGDGPKFPLGSPSID